MMRDEEILTLEWQVTGMDCGSCAGKVQRAVSAISGVNAVEVGVMTERLRLQLDPRLGDAMSIETTVKALGFGITPRQADVSPKPALDDEHCGCGHDHDSHSQTDHHTHSHANAHPKGTPHGSTNTTPLWFQTTKGRFVLFTGILLGMAWGAKLVLPGSAAELTFVLACVIGTVPVARRAFALLRHGMPFTIEALMTIAAIGALIIGAAEEAAMVVFLFAVGELLESFAADRARRGIRGLSTLLPATTMVVENDTLREVATRSLQIGQVVRLRPGDRAPCDGIITAGAAGMDESAVTGESLPIARGLGDAILAGSICTDAAVDLRVTAEAQDNTIARIIRLVEEAASARAPVERFIERFARIYMPVILCLSLLTAIVPPLAFGGDVQEWAYRALALLLVGCPCALVISVPASIASALAAGTRAGLLIKGGAVIEAAASIRHVAFDKTGTLTKGKPEVIGVFPTKGVAENDLLSRAAAVEAGSNHPLARAVLAVAEARKLKLQPAHNLRILAGIGAEGQINTSRVAVISAREAEKRGVASAMSADIARLADAGASLAVVLEDGACLGLIAFADQPRTDAIQAIGRLQNMGIGCTMLTGDSQAAAARVAKMLGLDARAELLPEQKLAWLRDYGQGSVMMVGDGVNDAPALQQATVGVAMGQGTDIAMDTADAVILRGDVTGVVDIITLAQRTKRNIVQNVSIALGLKAIFVVATVLGASSLWMAVLADTGATALVTANALRLARQPAVPKT